MATTSLPASQTGARPPRKKYIKAVGPRLRILLYVIFALVALLGANSIYLAAITALNALNSGGGVTYENWFYFWMFLAHLGLGFLLLGPFVAFGLIHMWNTRGRKNRRAVRVGYALFGVSLVLLASGVVLVRVEGFFELKHQMTRSAVYWIHVLSPLAAIWLYWLHRLAGPKIKWRLGLAYVGVVAVAVGGMMAMHSQDRKRVRSTSSPRWRGRGRGTSSRPRH
jgi:hypothetical protein